MRFRRRHGGSSMRVVVALLAACVLAATPARASAATLTAGPSGADSATYRASAQPTYFPETGFAIEDPRFLEYFNQRGRVPTFGFPISRTFQFLRLPTQFFQRVVLQLGADGKEQPNDELDAWLNTWLETYRQGSTELDKRVREYYWQPRPTGCLP